MMLRAGNSIINGEDHFIMIYLTEKDKKNIANMDPDCNVYCEYPDDMPAKYIPRIKTLMKMFKEDCENGGNNESTDSTNPDK